MSDGSLTKFEEDRIVSAFDQLGATISAEAILLRGYIAAVNGAGFYGIATFASELILVNKPVSVVIVVIVITFGIGSISVATSIFTSKSHCIMTVNKLIDDLSKNELEEAFGNQIKFMGNFTEMPTVGKISVISLVISSICVFLGAVTVVVAISGGV